MHVAECKLGRLPLVTVTVLRSQRRPVSLQYSSNKRSHLSVACSVFLFFCSGTRLSMAASDSFSNRLSTVFSWASAFSTLTELVKLTWRTQAGSTFASATASSTNYYFGVLQQVGSDCLAERLAIPPPDDYVDALQCDIASRRVSVKITYICTLTSKRACQ